MPINYTGKYVKHNIFGGHVLGAPPAKEVSLLMPEFTNWEEPRGNALFFHYQIDWELMSLSVEAEQNGWEAQIKTVPYVEDQHHQLVEGLRLDAINHMNQLEKV